MTSGARQNASANRKGLTRRHQGFVWVGGAALDSGAPSAVGVMQLPSSIGRVSRTQGLLWNCLPDAVWAECRGAALRTPTPPASKSGGRPWDSTLWLCENATAPLARCLSTARGTRHRALNPNSGAAIATLSKDGAQQHAVFTAAGRHSFSLWPWEQSVVPPLKWNGCKTDGLEWDLLLLSFLRRVC
jgi:hypothetical protein